MRVYIKLITGGIGKGNWFLYENQSDCAIKEGKFCGVDYHSVLKAIIKDHYDVENKRIVSYYKPNDNTIVYLLELEDLR